MMALQLVLRKEYARDLLLAVKLGSQRAEKLVVLKAEHLVGVMAETLAAVTLC